VPDTQVEQTYRSVRQRIIDGVYLPSERLVETDLAQSLMVSRSSVRAALQRLHSEGLIVLEPHRGAKVTALTLDEALQIMEVREGLEGWAAALAAQRISEEKLAELEAIVPTMDELLKDGRPLEYSEMNALLHQGIVEAANNPRLQQLIGSLKTSLVRYRFRTILVPGRSRSSFQEHSDIVAALRSRSSEVAEAAMRRHIAGVRRTMKEARRLMEL